jgi:hypothetical protein
MWPSSVIKGFLNIFIKYGDVRPKYAVQSTLNNFPTLGCTVSFLLTYIPYHKGMLRPQSILQQLRVAPFVKTFWNPKVQNHTNYKSIKMTPILRQINLVHAITPYFFQIQVLLPSTPMFCRFSKRHERNSYIALLHSQSVDWCSWYSYLFLIYLHGIDGLDSVCVLDDEAVKATNALSRFDVNAGATDYPPPQARTC